MTDAGKSPSFFSGVKSLFLEADDSVPVKPVAAAPVRVFGSAQPTSYAPVSTVEVSVKDADPKIRQMLEAQIDLAAQPAYSEFITAADSLASILPDENTRYRAALETISSKGHTVDKVLFDVDECLEALDKKEKENAAALASAREKKIGTREAQLAQLGLQAIELTAQLTALELNRQRIAEEIRTEESGLLETNVKFQATVKAYRVELQNRRSKISTL